MACYCSQDNVADGVQVLVSLPTQGFFVYRIYICAFTLPNPLLLFHSHSVSQKKIIVPLVWVWSLESQLFSVSNKLCDADSPIDLPAW